jgi:tetratricopeptide (TPR) repeat protein
VSRAKVVALTLGLLALAIAAFLTLRDRLPSPGSAAYEEATRTFYRGLASLQVGLLDNARQQFTRATELVPAEPASWANLGLVHLRLSELDASVAPIERAAALAPASSEVALLAGWMEITRGRLDEGTARFRRAIELDPRSLRARFALAEGIERAGTLNADAEAQQSLEELLRLAPDNLAVLLERTRLAAKRSDAPLLQDSVGRLEKYAAGWPAVVVEQYRGVQQAAAASNFADAARATAFLRNVLARVPAFQESLVAVRTPSDAIAEPFDRFLRLPSPSSFPSPADNALTYVVEPLGASRQTPAGPLLVVPLAGNETAIVATEGQLALDWNNDFRMDVVFAGRGGVRLLIQDPDGTFRDVTAAASGGAAPATIDASGAWAADIEMDGDLDVVVGVNGRAPPVLRNNGDGTWRALQPFTGVTSLRSFAWADVDRDGDPDAVMLDAIGDLHLFANRQAGDFQRIEAPEVRGDVTIAVAAGDANADGTLDLITLNAAGTIRRAARATDRWVYEQLAVWDGLPQQGAVPGAYRLFLADLDNNGGLDLIASGGGRSGVWLAGEDSEYRAISAPPAAEIFGITDVDADGQLDLVGLAAGQPVRLLGRSRMTYHWQVIRPRARQIAGDQRINSFGVGGEIEIRSGLLTQKQILTGAPVHFGLGARTTIDVARIVWPNGVMQAEFDPAVDQVIVAEQRLKGSCPWVFTYDGTGMRFVTDFLWRSPLGLRINAQDTAGVTQTEDWVRIRGDQLAPRDGVYDVRITAELWETHFIDHVALLVVDHPDDTEMFVDERFARAPPALATHATRKPRAVARAWDDQGRDVTELVTRQDGRYLATFERGAYQGIARDHFVEFELEQEISRDGPRWLVAHGWIYPTDSSINVAIGQGGHVQPRELALEAQDASGRWVVVSPDLGFPAGKNKTILIDLGSVARAGVARARRLRLRTNLEIYWDSLASAEGVEAAALRTVRVRPDRAELRFRGFSQTEFARREAPETPMYDRLAGTSPRWRDLVGYYTRFGDVRELVAGVDDRYVIMNAGDELQLRFPAPAPPPAGWKRDFVLIGDGWEKDGDFNTSFSKTVEPLPSHDRPAYAAEAIELEEGPVYRRHREDWHRYHTRYVTPRVFLDGLRTYGGP